jgi:type I restriction enzyme, S subunit
MKSYSSYKDSGVKWIGEIPSHWDSKRLKHVSNFQSGYSFKSEDFSLDEEIPVVRIGDIGDIIDFNKCIKIPKTFLDEHRDFIIRKNDIMVGMTGGTIGKSGKYIYDEPSLLNQRVCLLRNQSSILNGLLYHYVKSEIFKRYIFFYCYGGGQDNIGREDIMNMVIPISSKETQTQIVSFLDTKTQKIDELIEKTEQKIKLLKEKRTSLINHCVTKGLYPDVDMKDSGVEWIGEIPRDWNIIPLKFVGDFQNGIGKGSEFFGSGFPFMNYGDVYNNEITPISVDGKVQSDEIERERYSVLRGDVFFTRTSESKDDIGVSSVCLKTLDESVFSGFVIRFRFFDNSQIPEYSRYHFQTHWKKVFIESKMNIVTRSSLSQQVLGQLPVLIPSNEQQIQIVEYLDEQTQKIDSTIEKETQRIELLKEYRQSLISEVVTGKVDVRDYNG